MAYDGPNPYPITAGGTGATSDTQARINLGLEIGVDVQAFNTNLQEISALGPFVDGDLIIGSSVAPKLRRGPLISSDGSITWTFGNGTIDGVVSGGASATYIDGVTAWTNVTGTSQALAINQGYQANNAGLCTLTLPATAALGTVIKIRGYGAGGWLIAQNASQQIILGAKGATTSGTGGSVSSTNRYDQITLFCAVANTVWTASWDGVLTPV